LATKKPHGTPSSDHQEKISNQLNKIRNGKTGILPGINLPGVGILVLYFDHSLWTECYDFSECNAEQTPHFTKHLRKK
jgi:hypothetical protein